MQTRPFKFYSHKRVKLLQSGPSHISNLTPTGGGVGKAANSLQTGPLLFQRLIPLKQTAGVSFSMIRTHWTSLSCCTSSHKKNMESDQGRMTCLVWDLDKRQLLNHGDFYRNCYKCQWRNYSLILLCKASRLEIKKLTLGVHQPLLFWGISAPSKGTGRIWEDTGVWGCISLKSSSLEETLKVMESNHPSQQHHNLP